MQTNPEGQAGEQWRKDEIAWGWAVNIGLRTIARCREESDADQIIADHNAAAQLSATRERELHFYEQIDWFKEAKKLAEKLSSTREALEKYGDHADECASQAQFGMRVIGTCDCGWEALSPTPILPAEPLRSKEEASSE